MSMACIARIRHNTFSYTDDATHEYCFCVVRPYQGYELYTVAHL